MRTQDDPIKVLLQLRDLAKDQDSIFLLTERMIYIAASEAREGAPPIANLGAEVVDFIRAQNHKVINQDLDFQDKLHLLSKCLDMLVIKSLALVITPFESQLQMRALCLNNLSCVYKQNGQLEDALASIDAALAIEEILLSKNYQQTITTISTTYVNKCVILSQLKRHEQAAETIGESLRNLNNYLDKYSNQLLPNEVESLGYTKMFAHFNLAVEYEHMGLISLAMQHFEVAYQEAKSVGDWEVRGRVVEALKQLRKK